MRERWSAAGVRLSMPLLIEDIIDDRVPARADWLVLASGLHMRVGGEKSRRRGDQRVGLLNVLRGWAAGGAAKKKKGGRGGARTNLRLDGGREGRRWAAYIRLGEWLDTRAG